MSRSRSSKKRKIVDEDDLSSEESAAGEYNVERIIGHHGNPSKVSTLRFQVRWEGYDAKSDTWEPYKNVSDCSAFDDYVRASPALAAALSVKSATPKRDKKDPATPSANYSTAAEEIHPFPHLTTTEKDVVFEQLQKRFLSSPASTEYLNELLLEYLRFISLKIAKPHITYQPSEEVDKIWHAHIICTRQYHAFCSRCNNGVYIHHNPDRNSNLSTYRNTMKEYTKTFGVQPKALFWGAAVDPSPAAAAEAADDSRKDGIIVVKFPSVNISLDDLETVVEPNSAGCSRTEKISICETNAMQKLNLLFNIHDIKYKEIGKGVYKYVGDEATSGPGCSSNAIFFCKRCRHIWEFGFCERDTSCIKCDEASTPMPRDITSPLIHSTLDYIVRCFGCGSSCCCVVL